MSAPILVFRAFYSRAFAPPPPHAHTPTVSRRDYLRFIKESHLLAEATTQGAKPSAAAAPAFRPIFRGVTRLAAAGLLWQNYCRVTEMMGSSDKKRRMKGVSDTMKKAVAPVVSRHPQRRHGANGAQMGAGSATLDGASTFRARPFQSIPYHTARARACSQLLAHLPSVSSPPLPLLSLSPPPRCCSSLRCALPRLASPHAEYEWMLLMAEFAKKFCKVCFRFHFRSFRFVLCCLFAHYNANVC